MDDARPKMCSSPSPPPSIPIATFSSNLTFGHNCRTDNINFQTISNYNCPDYNKNNKIVSPNEQFNMQRPEDITNVHVSKPDEETTSDYKQWLHAMKLVARLPGGIPPEFRRKLWLSLADKYLKSKSINWAKEEQKCFCEKWREDDEELGIQIVKDLHRTGSTLCTGPAGDLNQAKLKRILLGYARYNPEVGYCQGFNMLGALILQVMDKNESESIKVMIYLVEGILPTGYFCGSMRGLQADMAVFRELMQTKLPRLAKHLQKLQGPIENAYEPPLTNVFTMQWFLTMFCTCLPMSCVLRVWDLVLIEGSDVLLRTALALWSLLEERVLNARSADDFYGKMGSFSSELLNGHLIDSNGLIEKVVQLGPIADIQKLRDKHLYNIAPIERQPGLQLYFDDDEPDIDEDSRLAVATVWGIPWGRRGSQGQPNSNTTKQAAIENKDRIALDISLLKKQYDRLRERQKQAQIILTTACTTAARQSATTSPLPVNQLLSGRPAIVTNKGRRNGPPTGAIPPARKPSLPAVLHHKPLEKQLRRGETLYWRDAKDNENRRDSLSWKEIKAERAALFTSGSINGLKSQKIRSGRLGKSDSSSYSEESDNNDPEVDEEVSSTDTSLCDDDVQPITNDRKQQLPIENNQKCPGKTLHKSKKSTLKQRNQSVRVKNIEKRTRPKSWAPSSTEIPFILMTTDSPNQSADENLDLDKSILEKEKTTLTEEIHQTDNFSWKHKSYSPTSDALAISPKMEAKPFDAYQNMSTRNDTPFLDTTLPLADIDKKDDNIRTTFDISNEGVTNQYFERVNSTERPTKLELLYSLNEDENVRDILKIEDDEFVKSNEELRFYANDKNLNNSSNIRCMDLLVDYSEKSSAACIEEAKTEISTTFQPDNTSVPTPSKSESLVRKTKSSAEKRRDPRRLTLTRSSTMDIEKRYEAFEKRFSMEICSNYTEFLDEDDFSVSSNKKPHQTIYMSHKKTDNINTGSMTLDTNHKTLSTAKSLSVDKKIPSTADLEQRFEHIQQQLMIDRNKIIKSPCDSENAGHRSNLNNSLKNNVQGNTQKDETAKNPKKHNENESNEKIDGEKLSNACSNDEEMSTETNEFEDATEVTVIEDAQGNNDQASGSTSEKKPSLQSKKEPPDESKDDNKPEKDGSSENPSSNIDKKVPKEPKSCLKKDKTEEIIEGNPSGSKITLDRTSPPSTEELEKRFNALEDQMSSKTSDSNETQDNVQYNKQRESEISSENKYKGKDPKLDNEESSSTNETEISQMKANISNNNVSADLKTSLTNFETVCKETTKRRLSEPPSTEDLERRYEVLKRRMSSRNFDIKTAHNDTHSTELQKTNQTLIKQASLNSSSKQSPPSTQNLEERFEKLHNKNDSRTSIITESPPSTAKLEERFEKLHNKEETASAIVTQPPTSKYENHPSETKKPSGTATKIPSDQREDETSIKKCPDKNGKTEEKKSFSNDDDENAEVSGDKVQPSGKIKSETDVKTPVASESESEADASEKKTLINPLTKNANKIKMKLIEELQAKIKEHSFNTDVENIDKPKSKRDPPKETFLKPTQLSSHRHTPSQSVLLSSLSFNDETLESHATSAYHKSGKREPKNHDNRKMVRRFSDLPSRSDLENRLQFLEEQLSKTVGMQRHSSDSEVASKNRFEHKTTFANVSQTCSSLDHRVQELEKRLKDNRTFSMDVECSNASEKNDIEISQVELATDTVAVTGKELVRYSSHGEAGDIEHQSPINININIQMTLNKEDIGIKKSTEVSKTDELDRRLQFLEKQLKTSLVYDASESSADNFKESIKKKDNKSATDNAEESKVNNNEVDKCDKNLELNEDSSSFNKTVNSIQSENNTNTDLSSADPPNLDTKNTESIQNETSVEESEEAKSDMRDCKSSDDDNKINQKVESPKSIVPNNSDKSHEDTNSQKQAIEQIKIDDSSSATNPQKEYTENNSGRHKTHRNSLQQYPQASANETSDTEKLEQLTGHLRPQSSKTVEPEISDTEKLEQLAEHLKLQSSETVESEINEKKNIEKGDNSDTKMTSEVEKLIGLNNCSQFVPVEVNKKTLVLLLDNEPKAVKVRRLTRANTQELEDLFQALEKQLIDRGQQKVSEKTSKTAEDDASHSETETSKAMSDLAKEIEAFSKSEPNKTEQSKKVTQEEENKQVEEFDWGSDPIKYHLKKKTVHLPSTKELEARFRSLERQIKLLEDVEKIDVEQRLIEIERKIKLQYSLSHEKDLNKFLELCEGKDPDEIPSIQHQQDRKEHCAVDASSCHTSPKRLKEPSQPRNVECSYRSLDIKRCKSQQSSKKKPIHPLEMLLDPSPDDSDIPTTGELEHRIRVMEENRCTPPSPSSRKSRSQSPPIKQSKNLPNTHMLEKLTASPTERELPTAEELEARLEALEREQCFNFKMQKNFQQFNQKLKDVVSPSLSFDELKSSAKTCDLEQKKVRSGSVPKPTKSINTISPKTIRFHEEDHASQKDVQLSTKTYPAGKESQLSATSRECLGVMGIRLMRETSPLRRKGTHTGVPLRTGENINDQLTSIQNTIKSIDSLCEEKPYRKEKCQQYIDSLFSDSSYFAHKKTSLEDLTAHNLSRSTSRDIGPSIRISDHSPAFSRSMGSADSIKSSSPLRSLSPLQYRSNRDLRREPSPRRRREEDREEHESRVRRDNLLPNNINYSHSILSHTSHSSLTKFHKVDSQLISNDVENEHEHEESLRHPTIFSTIDNLKYFENTNTSNDVNTTSQCTLNSEVKTPALAKPPNLDMHILPVYQTLASNTNTNAPVYTPAKLEIRHTTVTSTFYDRVLTEKQLGKQHQLSFPTNSQSPLISPQFERHIKPIYQQQMAISPTNISHIDNDTDTDTKNALTIRGASSTGKYLSSFVSTAHSD